MKKCHPLISAICNDLFYAGKLCDGVSPEQRLPLVDGLGPLTFVNVDDGQVF